MKTSRAFRFALLAAVALVPASASATAQGATVRIEPRPFYGATVTLEEGVRVFRPLPPDRYVIINPNNTPINLTLGETRIIERTLPVVADYGSADPRIIGGGLFIGFPEARNPHSGRRGIGNDGGGVRGGHHGGHHGGHRGGGVGVR